MSADITPFIKDAQALEKATGIPASVTLAQLIQESSGSYAGGLSGLAAQAKNLFGIKGVGSAGVYEVKSREYKDGAWSAPVSKFKKYDTFYESMVDHAKVLSNPRYKLSEAKSVNDFVRLIKAGGYATDPNYESALLGIINSKNLNQYNTGTYAFTPITDSTDVGAGAGSQDTTFISKTTQVVTRLVVLVGIAVVAAIFLIKAFPVEGVKI